MAWKKGPRLQLDGMETKIKLLWWQKRGLSYTATGYGSKIPTAIMVWYSGRWRRVYCTIYSNSGTCWIVVRNERQIVIMT